MTKNPFFKNAIACVLAGILGAIVILRIGHRFLIDWIPFPVQIVIAFLYLLTAIIYIIIWKIKSDKAAVDSVRVLAFWQGVIRYWIALDLCMFGFQKFFHLQFVYPLAIADNPFSSLTGEDMMWVFFGHFYAFTVIIGSIQIIGSLMLLFRQTRLLAVIILLPILVNVLLLDWFYDLGMMVNIYIAILVMVMIYLLLLEYKRLYKFFFIEKNNLPQFYFKRIFWKNAIRFSVIIIPLFLMAVYKFPPYYPEIYGKYEVKSMVANNIQQNLNPCRDSVLTNIYIDKIDVVFEYNNYKRRLIGDYKYNETTGNLTAIWHYPAGQHDTLFAKILRGKSPDMKVLTGHMGKEVFKMEMLRVNKGY